MRRRLKRWRPVIWILSNNWSLSICLSISWRKGATIPQQSICIRLANYSEIRRTSLHNCERGNYVQRKCVPHYVMQQATVTTLHHVWSNSVMSCADNRKRWERRRGCNRIDLQRTIGRQFRIWHKPLRRTSDGSPYCWQAVFFWHG